MATAGQRLREDARACLRAAIAAVEPEALVRRHLQAVGWDEVSGRVRVAAVGKAAAAMAAGARAELGRVISSGVVLAPRGAGTVQPAGGDPWQVLEGGHPVPDEGSVAGARAVQELAAANEAGDLLLCLLSGGGSALMTLPAEGLSLADLQATTESVLAAGADIGELNTVRKHLEVLKGGGLARQAAPGRVLGLVLSDVVGDRLDVIASGPLSPDPTTYAEAIAVLERREVWPSLPDDVRRHLRRGERSEAPETAKPGDPCFEHVEVRVIGNNRLAAEAALAEARRRGYATLLLTTFLTGEARQVGAWLAALAREVRASGQPLPAPACLVTAGETTVTVTGRGRGGRNQEVALGAALALAGCLDVLVASLGTDGVDGPTGAAGALADGETLHRARSLGLDARHALADNDSYPFFAALDDLIHTGPTGTNVMDLQLTLIAE